MKTLIITLLSLLFIVTLHAEPPEKPDPIDVAMQRDLDKSHSTGDMVQATAIAQKKWDEAMNAAYAKLKKAMAREEWKALETSQKAWLVFRDREFATQREIYTHMQGSMWRPVAVNEAMELVKARTLTLRSYLATISERD